MLPNFVQRAMRRSWVCGIYVNLVNLAERSREKSQKKMMSFMADQIARVVPKIVSEIQGSNTPPSSVDSKAEKQKPTKFSYKHFVSCNPKPFTGSDGVTAMLEWFDSIEVTFINSSAQII
ncbi:hypothetical protein Hanom_Chr03g00201371 [Helianthus anomalus]